MVSPTHLAEELQAADLAGDVESGYGDGAPAVIGPWLHAVVRGDASPMLAGRQP
ncbi:hypothetical protein [Streptomyces sp. NPDC057460]|uniref:hypothetical protein n=1 Tax=Streptomyces sp. NPDC057460 TaxID=3346141 RepID=UPI0036BD13FB